jgi:hypothetical protein
LLDDRSESFAGALGGRRDGLGRPLDRPRVVALALAGLVSVGVALGFAAWPALRTVQHASVTTAAHVATSAATPAQTETPAPPPSPSAPVVTAPPAVVAGPPVPARTPTPAPAPTAPVTAIVTVPSAAGWVNTGVTVAAGRPVTVRANGSWTAGPPESGMVGPDGSTQAWPDNYFDLQELGVCNFCAKVKTSRWEALVGYVGSDPPPPGSYQSASILPRAQRVFLVGSSFQSTAPATGMLWLAINDDAYSGNGADNAGRVIASITAAR